MSDDMFDDPGSGGGDHFDPNGLAGRLLLVKPHEVNTGIPTVHGEKDAVDADVHVLDGPADVAGTVLHHVYIFPMKLIGQLKGNAGTGRFNLGRLGKGEAKPGKQAPWQLGDPTDADRELARRYIASDRYKQNTEAAAVAAEPAPAAAAPAASDPWGSSNEAPPF